MFESIAGITLAAIVFGRVHALFEKQELRFVKRQLVLIFLAFLVIFILSNEISRDLELSKLKETKNWNLLGVNLFDNLKDCIGLGFIIAANLTFTAKFLSSSRYMYNKMKQLEPEQ